MTRPIFLLLALTLGLSGCATHHAVDTSADRAEPEIHRLLLGTWYEQGEVPGKSHTKITHHADGLFTIRTGAITRTGTWKVTGTSLEEQVAPLGGQPGWINQGMIVELSPTRVLILWKDNHYAKRYRSRRPEEI